MRVVYLVYGYENMFKMSGTVKITQPVVNETAGVFVHRYEAEQMAKHYERVFNKPYKVEEVELFGDPDDIQNLDIGEV